MALTAPIDFDEGSFADSYVLRSKKIGSVRTAVVNTESIEGSAPPSAVERGDRVYAQPETARQKIKRAIGPALRQKVRVDVRGLEDGMIRCQVVAMGGQDVSIVLPAELFPDDDNHRRPYIGASYSLAVVDDGGVRRPKLEWLPGDGAEHRAIKDRIHALANAFQ
ncbi:hypothetical protein [Stenotrophomonas maltophilia]|uniref:hypothetical protein n=1 Tax=Stenotrophomonas maltophilia TaxID=40324 RepID=UPI0012B15F51|nr:hypothetical protein [Stenotrophomonas maltophilia]QGL82012.1 hypothetical protein FEO94_19195 [Stenotrophomonas maltophilia]